MDESIETWLSHHETISPACLFPSGTVLDEWEIVAFVARGGSGEVYRVKNTRTGVFAAAKVLHKSSEQAENRFAREINFLLKANHPAFPKIYQKGIYSGHPYFVMELLEPLELPETDGKVAKFIRALCVGISYLHSHGLVHRDIKPANIMSRNGSPVIIDLGLLKKMDVDFIHGVDPVSIVDGHVVGVGTPGYAAPEQLAGEAISPSADLHALGVLANACFRGNPPLCWSDIIRRSTSTLPSQRYPSVAALASAIRFRHWRMDLSIAVGVSVVLLVLMGGRFLAGKWQEVEDVRRREASQARAAAESKDDDRRRSSSRSPWRSLELLPYDQAFSKRAGEVLGVTQLVWRTSAEYPWLFETNICYQGRASMKNTGNGGGEAISFLSTEIEGPVEITFHYRKNFYGSRFQIVSDGVTLFVDAEASHRNSAWYERKIEVPAGKHNLKFLYYHAGIGWSNEFNGIYLTDLKISGISRALDPLNDLPHGEHYYLVPNVNFSGSGKTDSEQSSRKDSKE